MKKTIITFLLLFFILSANAEETICPVKENAPWDKMKESDFTKEKVILKIEKLQKYFNGEDIVAEEFINQSLLVIKGGALRQSIEYWKKQGNQQNTKYWTQQFCEFMANKAYLVH